MMDFDTAVAHARELGELGAFLYVLVQTTRAKADVSAQQARLALGADTFQALRDDIKTLQSRMERLERPHDSTPLIK